jgi:iron complex outermembrane receptor protein
VSHANRLAATTAAAVSLLAANASAQNAAGTGAANEPPAVLQAQGERTVAFDIPAQPLAQALTAFGRQSGVQLAFDPTAAAGKTSVAVR